MKLKPLYFPWWKDFFNLMQKLSFYSLYTSLTILVQSSTGLLAGILFVNCNYLKQKIFEILWGPMIFFFFSPEGILWEIPFS